jgi:alkanesulfonate monooxygenase SsuD/methylene tetrahydromethanopterin reductase-like flavin-dependent oxidoreductase (luciferase family)
MDIGIGLPNTIPGTEGTTLLEWARRAEARGFSTLGTIGRVAYPNYEEMVVLAAAAGVTARIGLMTNILLGATRNPVLLAKEAASVDHLSAGRLTLGLGAGFRKDDFDLAGQPYGNRGRRLDQTIEVLQQAWRGEPVAGADRPIGPPPANPEGIPILIGGTSDAALARTVKYAAGWTAGGSAPEQAGALAERVRRAWKDAGRTGEPRIVALTYYALGDRADELSAASLGDYYGHFGQEMARNIPKTSQALVDALHRFEDAGVDEVLLDPTIADIAQVDMAADAVLE